MAKEKEIPDGNLFMMCRSLNSGALAGLPAGYHVRTCRKDELDLWMTMHFDDPETARVNRAYMAGFFNDVYAPHGDLFFRRCLFACDGTDAPVGTCFAWKACGKITTIHWFKVLKAHEGRGIGRALLSTVMEGVSAGDYPVYLHTQPSSFRAIKLYADFGFALLTDPLVGNRRNHLEECLPILRAHMPWKEYMALKFDRAPADFLAAAGSSETNQF